MTRQVIEGGWYGECLPDFAYAVTLFNQGIVRTHLGDIPCKEDKNILFLRCWSNKNQFKMAGQSHTGRGNVEWTTENRKWNVVGDGYGTNTVLYDNFGVLIQGKPSYGSQGLRFFDGRIHTGDETYYDKENNISQWTEFDNIKIGQDHEGAGTVVLLNKVKRLLEPGDTQFIRYSYKNPFYAIAIVKPDELKTVLYWLDRSDFMTLPLLNQDVPPVNIPPEKKPMTVPNENVALIEFKNSYGNVANNDDDKRKFVFAFASWLNAKRGIKNWGGKARAGVSDPSKATLAYWIGDNVPDKPTDGKVHAFQLISSSGFVSWDTRAEKNDPEYNNIDGRFFPSTVSTVPNTGGGTDRIAALEKKVQELQLQLVTLASRMIKDGDNINLQTEAGYYLCAEGSGAPQGSKNVPVAPGSVNATRTSAGSWETFKVGKN